MTRSCPHCKKPMTRVAEGWRCYGHGPVSGCGHFQPHQPATPLPLVLAAMAAILIACSSSQIMRESQVAHRAAQAVSAAEPVWIAAMDREGRDAATRACAFSPSADAPCIALRLAAERHVVARWVTVRESWQAVRAAHAAYADALEACQVTVSQGGQCSPLLVLSVAFVDAVEAFRCALRALGHPELDPIPGAPACVPDLPVLHEYPDGGAR